MADYFRRKVADMGRVVIPAELRRDYDIEGGQDVVFCRGENGIELMTPAQLIRRSQNLVRQYIPDTIDLTVELLQARKQDKSLP